MHDPQPGTVAWDDERDMILALIACPDCEPSIYKVCPTHGEQLDAMYARCGDPECPACH